jgi:predicted Holliday junction resolvase-like endonuclease
MDANDLTFGIKDVITIVVAIATLLGFYYALQRSVEKVSTDLDNLEDKQEKDHNTVMNAIKEHREDSDKREAKIYERIDDIRKEQKDAHDKLEVKIDAMADNLAKMNTNLSELTGYIKARRGTR